MDSELSQHHKREKVLIAAGIVGLALVVLLFLFLYSNGRYNRIDDFKAPIVQNEPKNFDAGDGDSAPQNHFENLNLSAKSAVVWDVKNQKFIFKKNEEVVLPLASLTKLMTALVASELLPQESKVVINPSHVDREEKAELYMGEQWDLKDLISLTLLSSSNTGARAIASVAGAVLPQKQTAKPEELFVEFLNEKAESIGLSSTHFNNDSGLDLDLENSGAYGDAKDIAVLMDYILHNNPELLEPTKHAKISFTSDNNYVHNLKNTNITVESIPGVLGSKTGFTDLAQGNLVVAFSPGLEGPFVAVVLGSTFDARFADINELVSRTLQTLTD